MEILWTKLTNINILESTYPQTCRGHLTSLPSALRLENLLGSFIESSISILHHIPSYIYTNHWFVHTLNVLVVFWDLHMKACGYSEIWVEGLSESEVMATWIWGTHATHQPSNISYKKSFKSLPVLQHGKWTCYFKRSHCFYIHSLWQFDNPASWYSHMHIQTSIQIFFFSLVAY